MKTNVMKKIMLFAFAFAFCATLLAKPIDVKAALAAPTDVKQDTTYDYPATGIKLTWTESNTNAYKYGVVYSLDKVNWTTSDKITYNPYCTISSLNPGQTYYFKVRTYSSSSSTSYGAYSNIITAHTAPKDVTDLKQTTASYSGKTATISWTASAGATGYYIYKSVGTSSSISNAVPVGTTSGTSYTLSTPLDNEFYVFVKPHRYGISYYSTRIGVVSAPSKPEGLTISKYGRNNEKNSVDFEWDRNTHADGYQLSVEYLKNGKKKWSKTVTTSYYYNNDATVKSSKMATYPIKYRVRSYNIINGKKVYSNWSSYKNTFRMQKLRVLNM